VLGFSLFPLVFHLSFIFPTSSGGQRAGGFLRLGGSGATHMMVVVVVWVVEFYEREISVEAVKCLVSCSTLVEYTCDETKKARGLAILG